MLTRDGFARSFACACMTWLTIAASFGRSREAPTSVGGNAAGGGNATSRAGATSSAGSSAISMSNLRWQTRARSSQQNEERRVHVLRVLASA